MSEIKALEKLRNCYFPSDTPGVYNEALAIANEIQAEVDNRFIELPVDADGVPIRPGDQMTDNTQRADGLGIAKWDVVSVNHLTFFDMSKGSHLGCQYVHVKPRTLEDVMDDFSKAVNYQYVDGHYKGISDYNELRAMYAAEIRELLGGDGE